MLESKKISDRHLVNGVASLGELHLMARLYRLRDRLAAPVVIILNWLKVKPDYLSWLGVVVVSLSLIASIYTLASGYFLIGLWVHVLIDGIDGPLARLGKPTKQGALVDVTADQIGVVAASVWLMFFSGISALLILLYTILYTVVIMLAWVRNQWQKPFHFLIRPRLYVYVALTIDYWSNTRFSWPILVLATLVLLPAAATGTVVWWQKIREQQL